jgi:predicted nucleic-acid-binding Zn-ribbon protein
MLCPKCGSRFKVSNTRSLKEDDILDSFGKNHLLSRVGSIVTWYTNDFVARKRTCPNCGYSSDSIELLCDDYVDILDSDKELIKDIIQKYRRNNDNSKSKE